jgi:hypothetical protein
MSNLKVTEFGVDWDSFAIRLVAGKTNLIEFDLKFNSISATVDVQSQKKRENLLDKYDL